MSYGDFFKLATGFEAPHPWQEKVALNGLPDVLSVPAGLGKTEGTTLAWAWRRLVLKGVEEPRHLVYCLPMRVLVLQTRDRLARCFGRLANAKVIPRVVPVHTLMGGEVDETWAGQPDSPWVLVGTQDMLLSRALNRGYGMSRFEWPVHFGLLNQDCRWIVDEVQLMGPGAWTTAQLDWMRRERFRGIKPCYTTWMSATVGTRFLDTRDRRETGMAATQVEVRYSDLKGRPTLELLRRARRPIRFVPPQAGKKAAPFARRLADLVVEGHRGATLSLVVCNTVDLAQAVFDSLPGSTTPRILLTSRFRATDRREAERRLLEFEERRKAAGGMVPDDSGLICISTQVVEAGLDISAHQLWSEIAPWPSVIQRLGRLNRDGRDQESRACFWPAGSGDSAGTTRGTRVGPYDRDAVSLAESLLRALAPLTEKSPFGDALDKLAKSRGGDVNRALQPAITPLPRAADLHGLFSTEQDLHGGFTDVSAFVRGTDPEADVTLFWRRWDRQRAPTDDELTGPPFQPDEGCAVPVWKVVEFLKETQAWIWDDETGQYAAVRAGGVRPGMHLMLPGTAGGYDAGRGWTGKGEDKLPNLEAPGRGRALRDDPRTETGAWVRLDVHLSDAEIEAKAICQAVDLPRDLEAAVVKSARFHDIGKAHPKWWAALPGRRDNDGLVAKCPYVVAIDIALDGRPALANAFDAHVRNAAGSPLRLPDQPRRDKLRLRWAVCAKLDRQAIGALKRLNGVRWAGHAGFRPGMRHEVASALALWHLYRTEASKPFPALTVYLVAAHHGKARTVLRSLRDRERNVFGVPLSSEALDLPEGRWPFDFTIAADGAAGNWTSDDAFELTGPGWTGLVADLLGPWQRSDSGTLTPSAGAVPADEPRGLGPFALAYLEALVQVADWRASDKPSASVRP